MMMHWQPRLDNLLRLTCEVSVPCAFRRAASGLCYWRTAMLRMGCWRTWRRCAGLMATLA